MMNGYSHNEPCEDAKGKTCRCACNGSGHKVTLTQRAIAYPYALKKDKERLEVDKKSLADPNFSDILKQFLGPQDADLFSIPSTDSIIIKCDWLKHWPDDMSKVTPQMAEERILATVIHDIFINIGRFLVRDDTSAEQWLNLLGKLMPGREDLNLKAATGKVNINPRSRYLWGSLMASLLSIDFQQLESDIQQEEYVAAILKRELQLRVYRDIRVPRHKGRLYALTIEELSPSNPYWGSNIKTIVNLMNIFFSDNQVKQILKITEGEKRIRSLIQFAACTSTLDLRHHPIVVKRCLVPLAKTLQESLTLTIPADTFTLIDKYLLTIWDKDTEKLRDQTHHS